MSNIIIAIDGACRRNGKKDCVSAGGCFGIYNEEAFSISDYEVGSTNQRGEMLALKAALTFILKNKEQAYIITDSEYLYNTMTKGWLTKWAANDWKNASNDTVKNKDIWSEILSIHMQIDTEVIMYHIKGHCLSVGKVTARNSISEDATGFKLYNLIKDKEIVEKNIVNAQKVSKQINGHELPEQAISTFIRFNTVADAIATRCVDAADILVSR